MPTVHEVRTIWDILGSIMLTGRFLYHNYNMGGDEIQNLLNGAAMLPPTRRNNHAITSNMNSCCVRTINC